MTISARKTEWRRSRGFTLLELIVTLAIVMLFVGTAFSFTYPRSRKVAEKFDAELRVYVRDTRNLAAAENRSIYLHFTPSLIYRSTEFAEEEKAPESGGLEVLKDFEVFASQGSQWIKITKSSPYIHLFSRSGITEPFSIRFRYEDSEFEYEFDALSALPMAAEL